MTRKRAAPSYLPDDGYGNIDDHNENWEDEGGAAGLMRTAMEAAKRVKLLPPAPPPSFLPPALPARGVQRYQQQDWQQQRLGLGPWGGPGMPGVRGPDSEGRFQGEARGGFGSGQPGASQVAEGLGQCETDWTTYLDDEDDG